MLPFSLGAALFSAISGFVVTKTGSYRPVIWVAWICFTLGYGLMYQLDSRSTVAEKVLYPLVASIGIGSLFQTPLIAIQAAMPLKDMATSTGTFGFLRTMGGSVGISIGQVIFANTLQRKIAKVSHLGINTSSSGLSEYVRHLRDIPDATQRAEVIQDFAKSISTIWLVCTPIIGACLVLVLFLRHYTLKRHIVREGDAVVEAKPASSPENSPEEVEQHDDEKQSTPPSSAHEQV